MYSNNQKLKTLYLLKILMEKTDEDNSMTVNDLIEELDHFGISAERKSIYTDIELLKAFGIDIICDKTSRNNYYVAARDFQLAELKLLVDAVQSSKFITHKKSEELIKKIEKLTSVHEAKALHRQVIVNDRVKTMNESIYYNVDAIHESICQSKKIQFKYVDYTLDKSLKFRRNGEVYSVSPNALIWSDENYYLVAYHERYGKMSHFRVDRMVDIKVVEENRDDNECSQEFDVSKYDKQVFKMFGGALQKITLKVDNSLINVIIDRFGREICISDKSEESFKITIDVAVTNAFYSWAFMQGSKLKIIAPESAIVEYKKLLEDIHSVY